MSVYIHIIYMYTRIVKTKAFFTFTQYVEQIL